jgi:hypothetical protein
MQETWTGNTTTKRNMDRKYNDQKKHGQTIQRPKETLLLLVVVLSVHVSFGRCIACSCFFWSLYCLSMFLLVVVLSVLQRPKETWTDNTTSKRNMDRQYNDQKKHGQTIQRPKETWTDNTVSCMFILVVVLSVHVSFGRYIACPCFFWSLYSLSMFLLVVVLSVDVSFGRCIACPCYFWSLYCLSMFLLVVVDNTTTKRKMDRQYNFQKKHGQTIQRPKETWTDNTTTKRNVLPVHVSFGRFIACPCFFW